MEIHTETEQRIIASAERLFYQKGKAGASMQDIADDAGINRTLLNYYFRTKDQLFEAVFRNAMARFVPNLAHMLQSDMPIAEYLPQMIETVIDTMLENPQIPIFVLQELTSNPDRMPEIIKEMGIDPELTIEKIGEESKKGSSALPDPRQVILNILSLCIFPFAARPVVTEILYGGDNDAFISAMHQRKQMLPNLVERFMIQNMSQ
jgi:AcrR family transcriptional regulator